MNTVCSTCGTTLHSQISRDFGQCGACRQAYESGEHRREPAAAASPAEASQGAGEPRVNALSMDWLAQRYPGFRFRREVAAELAEDDLERVRAVFRENYREANVPYLEKSFHVLRYIALAEAPDGTLAGFALAELRTMDLPRLPAQRVRLAGLCCIGMAYRRQKLFGALEQLAMGPVELAPGERLLSTGRMAHPASFRGMTVNPTAVPRRGKVPSEWQQQVGIAIAEAYQCYGFDPETFVVKGSGTPIGFPVIEIEATPEEWDVFQPVDRTRGDSLLGMAWGPDAPDGW